MVPHTIAALAFAATAAAFPQSALTTRAFVTGTAQPRSPEQIRARISMDSSVAASQVKQTKRQVRRGIMGKESYKRGASPFDKAIHKDIEQKMDEEFKSSVLQTMRDNLYVLEKGEGAAKITFRLAKEFGFCWGVERSIELAWASREAYPEKNMHITNELIHNPSVNDKLKGMDIQFIEKTEQGKRFDDVKEGDVVILPAFGASLEEMQFLDEKKVTTVDTTCPWVSKVWNVVDKHKKFDMTSVIHGKYAHEESIATASMADDYIIVKDLKEAQMVADYMLGGEEAMSKEDFMEYFKHAVSKGFDPDVHLKKIGIANQTTMYKKETRAIGQLFEKAVMKKYGPENVAENFAAFDTICDATQVRQDAITEMMDAEDADDLDFVLVVGGWDSSNTAHLVEIPHMYGKAAYHINSASCIKPDNTVEYRDVDGSIKVKENFLPTDRPITIAVTSGASTPDSTVQEALEAISLLKGVSLAAAEA